jgi:hypothetical protein
MEVERVRVREKPKPPSPFLGKDDLRDLDIFRKDIGPDGSKLIKGNREAKMFFYGLEKLLRGDFANIKVIDDPFFKIEEIREYSLGISKLFFLAEPREFFCNLIMIERENDIP